MEIQEVNNNSAVKNKDTAMDNLEVNIESGDGNISCFVDLDGLFGSLKFEEFAKYFKLPLNIKIRKNKKLSPGYMIQSKFQIITIDGVKDVKDQVYFKLGYSKAGIGGFDIFVITSNLIEMQDKQDFKSNIIDTFCNILSDHDIACSSYQSFIKKRDDPNDNSQYDFSGVLSLEDYYRVFKKIECEFNNYNMYIYVETFGNKDKTRIPIVNSQKIYRMIEEVVDLKSINNFLADICLSVSCGQNRITFANDDLFEQLGIKPNYNPLFCSEIQNANLHKKGEKSTAFKLNPDIKIFKYNLYSTFKSVFSANFNEDFKNHYTSDLMFRNFYNCDLNVRIIKKGFDLFKDYKAIDKFNSRISKEYSYRLEFRCEADKFYELILMMKFLVNATNFAFCNSESFFKTMQASLENSLKAIYRDSDSFVDFDCLIRSAIIESITNMIYIKGFKRLGFVSKDINSKLPKILPYSKNKVLVVNSLEDVSYTILNLMDIDDKIRVLNHLVLYNTRLDDIYKELFLKLFNLYYSLSTENYIEAFFNYYIYYFSHTEYEDWYQLKNIDDSEIVNQITFDDWFKHHILFDINNRRKHNLVNFLFIVILHTFQITEKIFYENLIDFLWNNNITVLIIRTKKADLLQKVRLSRESLIACNEMDTLYHKLLCFQAQNYGVKKTTKDELVRFANARYYYKNLVSTDFNIQKDPIFGFFLTKNYAWIKNRKKSLNIVTGCKKDFEEFLRRIIEWHPSKYTLKAHIDSFSEANIFLDHETSEMYKKYYNRKIELWYDSNIRFDIRNEPSYNIWMIVKEKNRMYNLIDETIKAWCQDFDSKYSLDRRRILNDLQIESLLIEPEIDLYSIEAGSGPAETQIPIVAENEMNEDSSRVEMIDDSEDLESERNLPCPDLRANSKKADFIRKINEQSKSLELLGSQMNEIKVLLEEIKRSNEDKATLLSIYKSQESNKDVDLNSESFDCLNNISMDHERLQSENIFLRNETERMAEFKENTYEDNEKQDQDLVLNYFNVYNIMKFRKFDVNELLISLNENLHYDVQYSQLNRILDGLVSKSNLHYYNEGYYRCNLYLKNGNFKSFNDLVILIKKKYKTSQFKYSEFAKLFGSAARPEKNHLIEVLDEMILEDILRCIEIKNKLVYFIE